MYYVGFKTLVSTAAYALKHNDTSQWGWGALEHHTSRVLFTHAKCAEHYHLCHRCQ